MPYSGECLACKSDVRNGHGRLGRYTYCPPCCARVNKCTTCQGIERELDPKPPKSEVKLGTTPYTHESTVETGTRVETFGSWGQNNEAANRAADRLRHCNYCGDTSQCDGRCAHAVGNGATFQRTQRELRAE